jgi:hypothetical protein
LIGQKEGQEMPSAQLKRAERGIASLREKQELPPEAADTIEELVAAIRAVEYRLAILEGKGHLMAVQDRG